MRTFALKIALRVDRMLDSLRAQTCSFLSAVGNVLVL